jgi:hypothetical protein
MRIAHEITTTEIEDGLENHKTTYTLITEKGKVLSFTCQKGNTFFMSTPRQKTYLFYCPKHTLFDLPPHILKKFQAKGKLLE